MKRFASKAEALWREIRLLLILATWIAGVAGPTPGNAAEDPKVRLGRQAREMAAEQGWIEGLRTVELIRPDVLSVRLDGGVVGALDPGNKAAVTAMGGPADYQRPQAFSITSPTDPNYSSPVPPREVGRASYEGRNSMDAKNLWPLFVNKVFWHDYFLYLPHRLSSGHTYIVRVELKKGTGPISRNGPKGASHKLDPSPFSKRFRYESQFDYDDAKTTTKVIKINQVAYSAMAKRRYAYVGWWAGDKGKVEYPELSRFEVIDEYDRRAVMDGQIRLRQLDDTNSGENVYQMDLSDLVPGQYHIRIPGFACSETFRVGGAGTHELYYHTMRAFFHQRCGQELRPPWTWVKKPACHTEIWESGEFVDGPGAIHHSPGNRLAHAGYQPKPGEKKMSFKGGYHDAADFDTFTYHLPATAQILAVYEMHPGAFGDGDLDLPESGNGIPDVLDEAEWGLSFYLDHQYQNGAVGLGRVNHCDARSQNIEGGKEAAMPPFGLLPPTRQSTPTFAAVAAQFSRIIRPCDAAKADRYLAAAKKAFDYAAARDPQTVWREFSTDEVPLVRHQRHDQYWKPCLTWAAGELLLATGASDYNHYVVESQKELFHWNRQGMRWWPYLMCDGSVADAELQAELRRRLLEAADEKVAATEEAAYRMGNGTGRACGWGACQGANHGDLLLRAYALTENQKYLDAACLNADWHLGANPLSKTLITNLGRRHPRRPEISWFLYEEPDRDMSGNTVKGISIYGIGPPLRTYPGHPGDPAQGIPKTGWPLWRSWRDVWDNFAEIYSEFTVPQTCGPAAMLYATLYALEKEGGLIPAGSKPDPLER